jgi:hypothetical protein
VSEACNDAAFLLLQFVVQVVLFPMIYIVYFYFSLCSVQYGCLQ